MSLNNNLDDLIKLAEKGRELWLTIKMQYSIGYADIVYIMPHVEGEINDYAMLHSKELLKLKHASRLLVIALNSLKIKDIIKEDENVCVIYISKKEMQALLKYNDMTTFFSQIYLLSFKYGSDCSIQNLLKYSEFSLEELVCIGLLGLPEYEEV